MIHGGIIGHQATQGIVCGRSGDGSDRVNIASHLWTAAGKIYRHLATAYCDGHRNGHRRLTHAIIVERIGEMIAAIRDSLNGGLRNALGIGDEGIEVRLQ